MIAREGYVGHGQAIPRGLQDTGQNGSLQKASIMAAVIVLGVGERLSAVGNMMVMERDWVPTLASTTSTPSLHVLNAAMRRIDLVCKLVAPLFVSALTLALRSIKLTAVIIAGMNAASVAVEWVAAHRVWKANARLRTPKLAPALGEGTASSNDGALREKFRHWGSGMAFFFSSDVCIPSLSLALLYFSVLSFSASMITYLLAVNFALSTITIARTCSTLVEVSATAVMPFGVKFMESRHQQQQRRPESDAPDRELSPAAVQRMGLWGLWIQLLCLLPVTHAFFSLSPASAPSSLQAVQLFAFLALSRMGLWTYDLAVQTLVQTRVPPNRRGEFSGVEVGFVSACELAQWVATAVWNKPEEFRYLGAAGSGVVALAVAAYTTWMWRQRGHLVHWEKVTGCKC
ncbi:hypothetical protein EWM64_g8761 [Hericium alpestre]|uniref:Solute carrier family 40 member n=1 Tax=Hericium alpestre TaxID=135208 RepID=A0A4Y9ZN31_9AGAM|nr:hypothetical protein EWM64_g8761 [Hericium alpestre]